MVESFKKFFKIDNMEIDKISIAKRIKERRIELQGKDRGRAEFAQSIGVLPQTYAAYERDRFNFNFINAR